jgi:hypothetical protein
MKTSKNLENCLLTKIMGVDGADSCEYILKIISSVASVAEREAGSKGSASAFPGRTA